MVFSPLGRHCCIYVCNLLHAVADDVEGRTFDHIACCKEMIVLSCQVRSLNSSGVISTRVSENSMRVCRALVVHSRKADTDAAYCGSGGVCCFTRLASSIFWENSRPNTSFKSCPPTWIFTDQNHFFLTNRRPLYKITHQYNAHTAKWVIWALHDLTTAAMNIP